MIFNPHSELAGKHAFLSASNNYWVNDDDEKLENRFDNALAAARGTALHEFAAQAIDLGIKLPRTDQTLNKYINDAIHLKMTPEQVLFYSYNSFGTADAISFRDNLLRIHDLKTGVKICSFLQLDIYAALFCLEYDVRPGEIRIECRIYQNDEVRIHHSDLDDIVHLMGKIVEYDRLVDEFKVARRK